MPQVLCLRINWNHSAIPLRIASRFFNVDVMPEPEFPFGRKGLSLSQAWRQLSKPDFCGMLLLDGDVAIDPHDYEAMLTAIGEAPEKVHTAPVKLWPISTHVETWVWGHGRNATYTQQDYSDRLNIFTFCFTYLPRILVEDCIEQGLEYWQFPNVDSTVCERARELDLPVHLVANSHPKHLNY